MGACDTTNGWNHASANVLCRNRVQDRSFTFILKTPPASFLIRKAAGISKGSGAPNTQKVGSLTTAQLKVRQFCSEGDGFA